MALTLSDARRMLVTKEPHRPAYGRQGEWRTLRDRDAN